MSKEASTVQQESPLKNFFLEKFGGMKQRVLSLRPETCERRQDGRKKKNARIERVNNKFLYRQKSDLCKIYMYTRCSTERIESTVNDTMRKEHLRAKQRI